MAHSPLEGSLPNQTPYTPDRVLVISVDFKPGISSAWDGLRRSTSARPSLSSLSLPSPETPNDTMSSAHNRPPLEVIPGESKRDKKRREWVEKVQVKHLDRLDNRDQFVSPAFLPSFLHPCLLGDGRDLQYRTRRADSVNFGLAGPGQDVHRNPSLSLSTGLVPPPPPTNLPILPPLALHPNARTRRPPLPSPNARRLPYAVLRATARAGEGAAGGGVWKGAEWG